MPRGGARPGSGRKKKPRAAAPTELKTAIARSKDLTLRLLDELHAVTAHIGEIEDLIDVETIGDKDGGRRRNAMLKAVSLGSRAAILKALLAAARAWAELERERGKVNPIPPFGPTPDEPAVPKDGWDFLDSDEVPKRPN